MADLTARQAEILALIRAQLTRTGVPPTRAEIAGALGFRSVNAAEGHLKALARKGVIELLPGASRGIRLLEQAGLPLVGRVAAGEPILATQHIEDYYPMDGNLFAPPADYLLRVQGLSMRDAGILDGDLLAVQSTNVARNGQVVVARIDDEVTVKRFHQRDRQVALVAENPDFSTIHIDLTRQALAIEGLAVGVIRTGVL